MTSRIGLVPGYTHIERFEDGDDYVLEDDGQIQEEVSYVTLDVGNAEPTLLPNSTTYRLIGLDSPRPYLQIAGTIFQGRYQDLIGTELLFAEDKDESDPSKKRVFYVASTEQRVRFKEVELIAK
ncbi:hypothetical protein K488DRAFT_11544, partial [Vararia minispora EC-137]